VKWIEKLTRQDSKVYDMLFERVLTCWFFFLGAFFLFFFSFRGFHGYVLVR